MNDARQTRVVRWKETLVALHTGFQFVQATYNAARSKYSDLIYTVEVQEDDPIWYELQTWLVERIPSTRRRALRAFTQRSREADESDVSPDDHVNVDAPEWKLLVENVGSRPHDLVIRGYPIKVTYLEPDHEAKNLKPGESDKLMFLGKAKLEFASRTAEGRDAVIDVLTELTAVYDSKVSRLPRVFRAASWGSWRAHTAPPRALSTVVLAGDMVSTIEDDLRRFLSQELRYMDLGIPWHRGYMLHGPPGTGKTSIVRALAGHLRLDLFYVALPDLEKDTDLSAMLSQLAPRSVLLLEDVDVTHGAKERDDSTKGVSLSGLLNALDGVVTPHGLITFMTTNNIDVIDPALVRAGRADRTFEVGFLVDEQLVRLMGVMLPGTTEPYTMPSVEGLELTAADVVEVIKQNLSDDPDETVRQVRKLIERRRSDA